MRQESDLCVSLPVSLRVLIQGLVKECSGVSEPLGQPGLDEFSIVSLCRAMPFHGEQGLALWS